MQSPSHNTQKVTGSRVKADHLRMKGEPTLVLNKEEGKTGSDGGQFIYDERGWGAGIRPEL